MYVRSWNRRVAHALQHVWPDQAQLSLFLRFRASKLGRQLMEEGGMLLLPARYL